MIMGSRPVGWGPIPTAVSLRTVVPSRQPPGGLDELSGVDVVDLIPLMGAVGDPAAGEGEPGVLGSWTSPRERATSNPWA
jgi:hypothetical protein